MKEPREIAEMIAAGAGWFELVREAEIIANECSARAIAAFEKDFFAEVEKKAREETKKRYYDELISYNTFLDIGKYGRQTPPDPIPESGLDIGGEFMVERGEAFVKELRDIVAEKTAAEASTEHTDQNPLNLPPSMDTERARKYIQKAIDAEYIKEQSAGRYKWQRNNKQMYAYFIYKIYSLKYMSQRPPVEEMEAVFCIKHLAQHASKANDPRNVKEWKKTIDEFFED